MAYKVLIPEDITAPGKDFLKSRGYEVVVVEGTGSEAFEREAGKISGRDSEKDAESEGDRKAWRGI